MRAGDVIEGRYHLLEQAGSGGHAVVWHAHDQLLKRAVALKHARSAETEISVHEAELLARVRHPNVVEVFDVIRVEDRWWLVMEYVSGRSLAEIGVMSAERTARLGAQVASGLAAVHAAGVVHRDITAANVLVSHDDTAKLSDFGISRDVHLATTLTGGAVLPGTLGYISPEVADGGRPDRASDVFALGATLFLAVQGRTPFGEVNAHPMALLRRTMNRQLAVSGVDGELGAVLRATLRLEPQQRPTAAQVQAMLSGIADRVEGDVPTGDDDPHRGGGGNPRPGWVRRAGAALAGVVLLLLVAAAGDSSVRTLGQRPSGPNLEVGETHTVDPCGLATAAALDGFGAARYDADRGNFNRCDILIRSGDDRLEDVKLSFENPTPQDPVGPFETYGRVRVLRLPGAGDECDRTIVLPDHYQIDIDTVADRDDARLCVVGDTATENVVDRLSHNGIPRRTDRMPANSLFWSDACRLPGSTGLSQLPGVAALNPLPDFGNWACRYNSTIGPGSLRVIFDRNVPLTADNGTPETLSGHTVFIQPDGYGPQDCLARIVHRGYTTALSTPAVELALVVIENTEPAEQRCLLATDVATAVTTNLPPS
ncbi:serine/threonine-protein kinase [Nocardia alni]|uniref:serine/threonine-protein kinase n=1 Tax=Nocardia alni TaxID=2815723 RepID=UPI001C24BE11|nr:serine/threonine-protein kinase [Nocardia alni]